MKLQNLSKKQLLLILETIYLESRDFYAQYQDYWQLSPLMNKPYIDKDKALDDAWEKFNDIRNWADGANIKNILNVVKQPEDNF